MIRRHLMVATYCCKINRVSAPGCSSRFAFLTVALTFVMFDSATDSDIRFSQSPHEIRALVDALQTVAQVVQCAHGIGKVDDDIEYLSRSALMISSYT